MCQLLVCHAKFLKMFQADWPMDAMNGFPSMCSAAWPFQVRVGGGGGGGGGGGDQALNSLLKASFGLKLSLSCRA